MMVFTISVSTNVLTRHKVILTITIGGYVVTVKFACYKISALEKLMIIAISVSTKVIIFTCHQIILSMSSVVMLQRLNLPVAEFLLWKS